MTATQPQFTIATADVLQIADHEISGLLMQVYIAGGFTTPVEAASLFEPSAVRKRGTLIGARDNRNSNLAGFIIVVPPDSPARKLAANNEGELHLLGVLPEYRGHGLGRRLIDASIDKANRLGYSKLILWTQLTMISAQRLYEAAGFQYIKDIERNGRKFKVYERALCA
jgi:ribosomal protein S18 acetylase RimI-like enzyme